LLDQKLQAHLWKIFNYRQTAILTKVIVLAHGPYRLDVYNDKTDSEP